MDITSGEVTYSQNATFAVLVQFSTFNRSNKPFWGTEISFLQIDIGHISVTLRNRRGGGAVAADAQGGLTALNGAAPRPVPVYKRARRDPSAPANRSSRDAFPR
jgi:hypothetical protein